MTGVPGTGPLTATALVTPVMIFGPVACRAYKSVKRFLIAFDGGEKGAMRRNG